ncbi:MAG: acylase [Leptolyngbyaceae cyanobacterium]
MLRTILPLATSLLAIALFTGCLSASHSPNRPPIDTAIEPEDEILWDTWGIPHIYGSTETALFQGMGWAQMESHGDLILRLYGEARGRAAEYWGEAYLDSDRFMRTMGVPGRGMEWLAQETPQMQANLAAFAEGINRYAAQHPERLNDEVEVVLPVTASDVLAHVNRTLHFTFVTNPGVIQQANQVLAKATVTDVPLDSFVDESLHPRIQAEMRQQTVSLGSNAWAIAPSRSTSGNALLLANPHLPWDGLFLFYEQHLVGPEVNVYGATLVGIPGIAIGFNDRLGWTLTVNPYDGADLFTLDLSRNEYPFGEAMEPLERRTEILRVREPDGTLDSEILTIQSSVHGPIIAANADQAVALRVAGLDQAGAISQWWDMAQADSLPAFEAALARLQIPLFNVVYADADGHILYVFNGAVPQRPFGTVDNWAGAVDGSDPATLWQDYHAYEDLPRLLNPETGWLQNANDPPWTATLPSLLSPQEFPAYFAPLGMRPRPQRSITLLQADESITFDELIAYKHDTHVELSDRVLDDLLQVAEASPSPRVQAAATILANWDRTVDADSRGALLFETWLTRWLQRDSNWLVPWSARAPLTTPSGITDELGAIATLATAANEVEAQFGSLDIPWGEVHRARLNGYDVPVSGGPGFPHGVFRVAQFFDHDDGTRTQYQGDTYYAVMEFTPQGVRAKVLTAYGNASQPHSPHFGDQLDLYSRQEMRPVWKTRFEVEANTAWQVVLDSVAE